MSMTKLVLPLVFALMAFSLKASPSSTLDVTVERLNKEAKHLNAEAIYHLDSSSFSKLRPLEGEQGFTKSSYWLRVALANTSDQPFEGYLKIGRPITDTILLYRSASLNQAEFGGDQIALSERSVAHRLNLFPIKLEAGASEKLVLYLKSDGETLDLYPEILSDSFFNQQQYSQQLLLGAFYGMLFLSALIYWFFYSGLKELSFLHYGFYVISIALLQGALDGFVYQFIFPGPSAIGAKMVLLTAAFSNFFLLKYGASFLKVSERLPKLYNVYRLFYYAIPSVAVLLFINDTTLAWAYPLSNVNGLFSLLLILGTLAYIHFKVEKVDLFFRTGIFFLVLGLLAFVMNNLSLLPNNFWIQNGAKFGIALEVVFLSLSMTNLIGKLRMDKERSQREALQKSEDISAMKTYFMSNISHELRTPINAILGIATEQLEVCKEQDDIENYKIVKSASLSLLSNVNDILDFEQIEKGSLKLDQRQTINLEEIVDELHSSWSFEARRKGLKFSCAMEGDYPPKMQGDEKRLRQVLNNILSNAVKFTEKGAVMMRIQTESLENEMLHLSISVSDTGIGMQPEELSQIFESFNQMKLNNKRRYGGLGLGLTIVKHLMQLFGAQVKVRSEAGMGTKVDLDFELPIANSEKERVPNNNTHAKEKEVVIEPSLPRMEAAQFERSEKTRVLMAEDNVMNQMILKRLLSNVQDLELEIANDGLQALQLLGSRSFDVVLMDLQMPNMDGYEACEAIRAGQVGEVYRDIPIIAVTADATQETEQRVYEIGMNAYLTKPVRKDQLVKWIADLSGKMRMAV